MQKFTKDGQELEGVQWEVNIESEQEIIDFCGGSDNVKLHTFTMDDSIIIEFPNFGINLDAFDWLVRSEKGQYKGFTNRELKEFFTPPVRIIQFKRDLARTEEIVPGAEYLIRRIPSGENFEQFLTWMYALTNEEALDDWIERMRAEFEILDRRATQPIAEHCIVGDNSGHEYVIPLAHKDDWNKWLEIPEEDEASWETPSYAEQLDGGGVIFKEYRLG